MTTERDTRAVVDALRGHDRFLVTTHENPDGDALGSLLAMQRVAGARQGQRHVPRRPRLPSTASWSSTASSASHPDDHPERVLVAGLRPESRIADRPCQREPR